MNIHRYIIIVLCLILIGQACVRDKRILQANTPVNIEIPGDLKASGFKVPSNNPLTKEGIELGRRLFYDPILSLDNKQSCASCHNQKFAFTDSTNKFSVGVDGSVGNRNSMPLFNLAFQKDFFWDGRTKSLEIQALEPIEDVREMKSSVPAVLEKLKKDTLYPYLFEKAFGKEGITANTLGKAIAQFERTILSGNSRYDLYKKGLATLTPLEEQGLLLFQDVNPNVGGDCIHCHVLGSTFTDFELRNNGLDTSFTDKGKGGFTGNNTDMGKFRTPTLRNIAVTAPYMHDGRFKTLDQVLQHYNIHFLPNSPNIDPVMKTQVQGRLNKNERDAIIAFLKTLTDSVLLTNPAYSNPFK